MCTRLLGAFAPFTVRQRDLSRDGSLSQRATEGATPVNAVSRGRYGIISLFDGVSSVVPILKKKFGYPPTAVILAECDLSLRQLVCTEFGYRSDEKWGFTPEGSAVLYVKDVRYIIDGQCKVLQDLVRMFPDCKSLVDHRAKTLPLLAHGEDSLG